jgi:hypothetical protein
VLVRWWWYLATRSTDGIQEITPCCRQSLASCTKRPLNNVTNSSSMLRPFRVRVPPDGNCLFYCISYLMHGKYNTQLASELRAVCAETAFSHFDPETREIVLGMPIEEYARKITRFSEWGGEVEIVTLARHFGVKIVMVSCENLRPHEYAPDEGSQQTIFLLYTGQHYDPIVSAPENSESLSDSARGALEQRIFSGSASELSESCFISSMIEIAIAHNEDRNKKLKQRRQKKIKCLDCGALCNDSIEFGLHCENVDHSEDFAYLCEEIEVVIEEGEDLPEGHIDLADPLLVTFYNSPQNPLSNHFESEFSFNGNTYLTAECCWLSAKYYASEHVTSAILMASADEALSTIQTASNLQARPDWDSVRFQILVDILVSKFKSLPRLSETLLGKLFFRLNRWPFCSD